MSGLTFVCFITFSFVRLRICSCIKKFILLSDMKPPSVWNLEPHPNIIKYSQLPSDSSQLEKTLTTHHFNVSIAILIPDRLHLEDCIKDIITKDSDYYKITGIPMYKFVEKPFIDAFIKHGETTLLSIDTMIDVDDCCCITPNGLFILSVTKTKFLSLGIQASPSVTVKRQISDNKYQIVINLKSECFTPGKNNYERVLERLKLDNDFKMDVIVSWDPGNVETCPSSIAKYFYNSDLVVDECSIQESQRVDYNVKIPTIKNTTSHQFFEWLGYQCLGIQEYADPAQQEFLSSYLGTDEMVEIGQCFFIQWSGLIPTKRIHELFKKLREFIASSPSIPFIGLHVHGFDDSPVSWGEQVHQFITNGDNNVSYIFQNDGTTRMCKNQIAPYT